MLQYGRSVPAARQRQSRQNRNARQCDYPEEFHHSLSALILTPSQTCTQTKQKQ